MGDLKGSIVKMAGVPGLGKLVAKAIGSSPVIGPMLQDSVSLTMLSAGNADNVIPATAEAAFVSTLRDLVKAYGVKVEVVSKPEVQSYSSSDNECFKVIERALR